MRRDIMQEGNVEKIKSVNSLITSVYDHADLPNKSRQKTQAKWAKEVLRHVLGKVPTKKEVDLAMCEIWPN